MGESTETISPVRRRLNWLALIVAILFLVVVYRHTAWQGKLNEVRKLLAHSDAKAAWERAVELRRDKPDDAELAFLMAKAARRAGRIEDAKRHLDRARQLGWPQAELEREQILATLQSGGYEQVRGQVDQIIKSDLTPEETDEFYEAMARGHLAAYRVADLRLCLKYWLQTNSEAAEAYFLRGDLEFRLGHYTDAAQALRKVLSLKPDYEQARRLLVETLITMNQITDALQVAEESTDPDHPKLLLFRAQCEHRQGRASRAKELLEQALKNGPTPGVKAGLLEELGRLSVEDAQPEQAIGYLETAVALAPESSGAWHILASAYKMAGRPEKAKQARERADKTQAGYNRLTDITHLLLEQPDNVELRFEAGKILMDNGLRDEGAAWMQTALQYNPDFLPAHRELEAYCTSLGRVKEAAFHRLEIQRLTSK